MDDLIDRTIDVLELWLALFDERCSKCADRQCTYCGERDAMDQTGLLVRSLERRR